MPTSKDLADIKTDIALLKKDVFVMDTYAKNVNTAVEKISDLTSSMHRMIELHEERIARQADDDNSLRHNFEMHLNEDKQAFEKFDAKIASTETKLLVELAKIHTRLAKIDIKRAAISGALLLSAFIFGPLLSGYFQAYFAKLIHP